MILSQTFPIEIQDLIREYNTNHTFNTFLYKFPECNELFKQQYGKGYNDRFEFVHACFRIERQLTPLIHKLYHGKRVRLKNGIEGTIRHELTREYDGRTLENETSFRSGDQWQVNDLASQVQHIELWVETGNRMTSHLYDTADMELLDWDEQLFGYWENNAEAAQQQRWEDKHKSDQQVQEEDMLVAANTAGYQAAKAYATQPGLTDEEYEERELSLSARYDLNGNER